MGREECHKARHWGQRGSERPPCGHLHSLQCLLGPGHRILGSASRRPGQDEDEQ
jgi:hypothetical protein